MNNNSSKNKALKTLVKYKCYSLNNLADIKRIIEAHNYTIIEYKKHTNSTHVSELIKKLKIEHEIQHNNSFLYIKTNLRFVFINAELPDEDKCSLLRHELGHICDAELINGDSDYSEIKKEEFANEFSLYTKNPGPFFKLRVFVAKKWKLLISVLALTACVAGILFAVKPMLSPSSESASTDVSSVFVSDGTFYVTSYGKKYHHRQCIIVRYRTNLTLLKLDEALSKGYTPCKICNIR